MDQLKDMIREVKDFPKPGIGFKDITTLLRDASSFNRAVDLMAHRYLDEKFDVVLGVEARGFVMGAALAYKLNKGVILVRKPGKLPYKTNSISYDLEYGTDTLEIHQDAITPGERVLIVDDLLATGGTVKAVADLITNMGGEIVECAFLAELSFLSGRKKLEGLPVYSLLSF
ncbi:MAG: adenine phosphoribosyltransferase [Deltaproteobacteria bacterium]|nr:MAG: adenine phosphoribosyltransferase [Deltaproteobacteria bacterium]